MSAPPVRGRAKLAPEPSGDIVIILVGPDSKKFHVHKNLLVSSSIFFEAALKKKWQKDKIREIQLQDDDEEAFELYAHWLYSGKGKLQPPRLNDGNKNSTWILLGPVVLERAVAMGQKFQDTAFQAAVVNFLFSHKTWAASTVRDSLLDEYVRYPASSSFNITSCNRDFLVDVIKKLLFEREYGHHSTTLSDEDDSESPRRPSSLAPKIEDELVAVYVGPEKRKFSIHEGVLRSRAPYFDAALRGDRVEGQMR
ncbi:MAG: hypothetical protein M1822_001250 [Bathelium mastoideum]|nr:MAG: hypothetical protein M1822_001250 [Bathelium mastoideum]